MKGLSGSAGKALPVFWESLKDVPSDWEEENGAYDPRIA
jgi:hypothetical protein